MNKVGKKQSGRGVGEGGGSVGRGRGENRMAKSQQFKEKQFQDDSECSS